jgi:excisionase family DNA binding protein
MRPSLRDLLDAPDRARSLQPEAMAEVLGDLVLLFTRLLLQASATPETMQATKPEDPDRLLTVDETATILNLRPARVYELARRRVLPAVRVGKYVRVRSRDLQSWIEDQREEGVDGRIQPGLSSPPPMTRASMKARGKQSR